MFGVMSNPAAAYRKAGIETKVETASPHMLVTMLFDGALLAITQADHYMAGKQIKEKGDAIGKAINIIDGGLKASLDRQAGGQLAERLAALYEYMCTRLLQANLRNDRAILNEVSGLLKELKSAWEEIGDNPATHSTTRTAA